jgi:hypothetical protein
VQQKDGTGEEPGRGLRRNRSVFHT